MTGQGSHSRVSRAQPNFKASGLHQSDEKLPATRDAFLTVEVHKTLSFLEPTKSTSEFRGFQALICEVDYGSDPSMRMNVYMIVYEGSRLQWNVDENLLGEKERARG